MEKYKKVARIAFRAIIALMVAAVIVMATPIFVV
jgi:hypothetical protein